MPIERPTKHGPHASGPVMETDPGLALSHPTLSEYLTRVRWEDGGARETATLLIFARDDSWSACLNDRDSKRALWVSAESIPAVLDALEHALTRGGPTWKAYRDAPKKK